MLTFSSPGDEDTHFYGHWTNGFWMYMHNYISCLTVIIKWFLLYIASIQVLRIPQGAKNKIISE